MQIEEIKLKLSEILFNLGLTDKQNVVIDDEEFHEIFESIDSLNLVNFVVDVENSFNIELADEYLLPENFVSIDILANYVNDTLLER